ncbi:MAG TPA: hypothetical protein VKU02_32705, partial [Gemmataceae bacterium]|nr:hypothetical protein [Gemmataceae bacterium]
RGLGWFSIGLGLAEVLAPRAMAVLTGVRSERLLQLYGLRELAVGLGILCTSRPTGWMWGRVAGDALDIATLLAAAARADGECGRSLLATAAVGGVTALDIGCAAQLSAAAALEG